MEMEVKYLPVLYNASKGDIEHFQSFVTKTRLSDLESIIEGVEKIKTECQKVNGTFKYDSCYDDVLSYLKSLRQS